MDGEKDTSKTKLALSEQQEEQEQDDEKDEEKREDQDSEQSIEALLEKFLETGAPVKTNIPEARPITKPKALEEEEEESQSTLEYYKEQPEEEDEEERRKKKTQEQEQPKLSYGEDQSTIEVEGSWSNNSDDEKENTVTAQEATIKGSQVVGGLLLDATNTLKAKGEKKRGGAEEEKEGRASAILIEKLEKEIQMWKTKTEKWKRRAKHYQYEVSVLKQNKAKQNTNNKKKKMNKKTVQTQKAK